MRRTQGPEALVTTPSRSDLNCESETNHGQQTMALAKCHLQRVFHSSPDVPGERNIKGITSITIPDVDGPMVDLTQLFLNISL